ncbi:MAG: TetR/AcrR family transcriptional regulator [Microcoleaceae cyanobacterium MO_207.B10]|nr:TetR/AcrR family transcriptional regulator [Microcoleaceae cyanobacterium MO_207.B10]
MTENYQSENIFYTERSVKSQERIRKIYLMSKEQAIAQLIQVFRQYGYEGTTLARLSKATGLGKASLYNYFPGGKQEMAATVLEYGNNLFQTTILKPLQADSPPEERIQTMT